MSAQYNIIYMHIEFQVIIVQAISLLHHVQDNVANSKTSLSSSIKETPLEFRRQTYHAER